MPIIDHKDIQKVNPPLIQGFEIGTLVTQIDKDEEKTGWLKKLGI